MTPERRKSRIARWGVPVGAIAVTGIVAVAYGVSGAQAAPRLPVRTTAQLLAAVSSAQQPAPMTATVQESASLGFPSLPNTGSGSSDPMSALSWLSGTHTIRIWYADQAHVRVAVPVPMGETDLRRDGRNVWTWDSRSDQATHLVLPPHPQPGAFSSGSSATYSSTASGGSTAYSSTLTFTPPTPQQAARQLLAAVGPTTKVGLQQNVTIAGQAAYQLSLAPKASGSLIGQIRIAIDAHRGLPLRVQIFARGASNPAFQLGYTSIQFGTPAASNFAFTPPHGAKVKTVTVPAGSTGRFRSVAPLIPAVPSKAGSSKAGSSKAGSSKAGSSKAGSSKAGSSKAGKSKAGSSSASKIVSSKARPHLLMRLRKLPKGAPKAVALPRSGFTPGGPMIGVAGLASSGVLAGTQVLGKDWTSVLVLPAPGLQQWIPPGAAAPRGSATVSGGTVSGSTVSSSTVNPGGPMQASKPGGPLQHARPVNSSKQAVSRPTTFQRIPLAGGGLPAVINDLMRTATPVHGAWGSGRLLTTSLVSVLVTNGRILIGSVTPAVLYADAAQLLKQGQPSAAQPGTAPPSPAGPGTMQPKSAHSKRARSKSAQPKSAQSKSAQSNSARSKSAQSNSAMSKSAMSKSAMSKSAMSKSAQSNSAMSKLARSKSAQPKSARSNSAQSR